MHTPHPARHGRLTVVAALAILVAACGGGAAGPVPSAESIAPTTAPTVAATTAPTAARTLAPTPSPSDGATAGQTRTDAFGIAQVWVPAGTFRMGTSPVAIAELAAESPPPWVVAEFDSEQPDHEVTLSHGFWIDRDEVTNAAFAAFVDAGGYTNAAHWSDAGWDWLATEDVAKLPPACQGTEPQLPRLCVTWFEAEAYAAWRAGRLPTEAEWEFAARGPDSSVYPWGAEYDAELANVTNTIGPRPVGSFPQGASWVGANDMAGNAMEWVADWLDAGYYATSPATDPPGPSAGTIKVEKGGWWGSNPFVARSAYRHYEDPPSYADKHIGFRVASQ